MVANPNRPLGPVERREPSEFRDPLSKPRINMGPGRTLGNVSSSSESSISQAMLSQLPGSGSRVRDIDETSIVV